MNPAGDSETSAIERMLRDRPTEAVPPALRMGVLTAVSDVLRTPAPGTSRMLPDAFLIGTAVALLILGTLPWAEALRPEPSPRPGATPALHLGSCLQRAAAAGITLDGEPVPGVGLAASRAGGDDDAGERPRALLRSLDARTFLPGDL